MEEILAPLKNAPLTSIGTYVVVYALWGIGMNTFGKKACIAEFRYWWQIITVYLLYMIPISLILSPLEWYAQYAYGLFFMGILEFGGYALKSSIAHPGNILDRWFGERNFALGMTLFFASYFPLGNAAVEYIHELLFC
ncbi:MAG: hypothetical protein KDC12_03115 [Flavobacteriales bacterium]|nr:hypothetical protein [Flavobacteriales bacterium]